MSTEPIDIKQAPAKREFVIAVTSPQIRFAPLTPDRECRECRECCVLNPVEEIAKPARTPCKNICSSGCRVHPDRDLERSFVKNSTDYPSSCASFSCMWLLGHGERHQRPDKVGVVVTVQDSPLDPGLPTLFETRPGALASGKGRKLVGALAKNGLVLTVGMNGAATMTGPDDKIAQAKEITSLQKSGVPVMLKFQVQVPMS